MHEIMEVLCLTGERKQKNHIHHVGQKKAADQRRADYLCVYSLLRVGKTCVKY